MIDFITASHDAEILERHLLVSPIFRHHRLIIQKGYSNISKAYNEAVTKAPIKVWLHHDVYLPATFERELYASIEAMDRINPKWGVLGAAGVQLIQGKRSIHGHILDRGREWGHSLQSPQPVDTIDELLLITKGDFRFDENLGLHFYGADICMQAKLQGRTNYVIPAFCHHNSNLAMGHRSESFKECGKYFTEKYKDHLPIATTCIIIS